MRALVTTAVALLAHPAWAASPLHSAQQEKALLARLEATENDGSLVEICKDGLTNWEGDVVLSGLVHSVRRGRLLEGRQRDE